MFLDSIYYFGLLFCFLNFLVLICNNWFKWPSYYFDDKLYTLIVDNIIYYRNIITEDWDYG